MGDHWIGFPRDGLIRLNDNALGLKKANLLLISFPNPLGALYL